MADWSLRFDKGLNTAQFEGEMDPGFMRQCTGGCYLPEDPTRLWKIPGRTAAGTLPSTTNVYGLEHCQFDAGDGNQLVALCNGKVYRSDAATSSLSWATLKDGASADYARTGSYLRAVHDGWNKWIIFDGASGARAIVLDEDGNAKLFGMKKPTPAPTGVFVSSVGTNVRPNASTGTGFATPANAYDTDDATAATATLAAGGTKTTTWTFAAGAVPASSNLYVLLATSSLPPIGEGGGGGGGEDLICELKVEVSEDTGGTWRTIFQQNAPVSQRTVSTALATAANFNTVQVKATLLYTGGVVSCSGLIYDIRSNAGSGTAITDGTYYYAVTEVYQRTLTDGTKVQVESAESDTCEMAVGGATKYGVTLTLPAQTNVAADGCPNTVVFRRIYRSTSTGVWPNLGLVGDNVSIAASTWTDDFSVGGTTLGSPGLFMAYVGSVAYPAAGQPPALRDACLFKGAVVGIPASDPRRIQWSMSGYPEYWPACHDYPLQPDERNDEIMAVRAIGEYLLLFLRTRVIRLRTLPFAIEGQTFDINSLESDILSPNEGLVGTRAICAVQSQKGHATLVWASDNGLWMTDGSLVSERGLGVVKLTSWIKWSDLVDPTKGSSVHLVYDTTKQTIRYSYIDADGTTRRELWLHTSPHHWIASNADQLVPKITGPHEIRAIDYALGELTTGALALWSLKATTGVVYNENTGTTENAAWWDSKTDIDTLIDSGWRYPAGLNGEFHALLAWFSHTDFGAAQVCDVSVFTRRDQAGLQQHAAKRGVPLHGNRVRRLMVGRSGSTLRLILRQTGKTSGSFVSMDFDMAKVD